MRVISKNSVVAIRIPGTHCLSHAESSAPLAERYDDTSRLIIAAGEEQR